MELSAYGGGFPVTGSCGLAFAQQSGSLTSCLREKTSQITQITWIQAVQGSTIALNSEIVLIEGKPFNPAANVPTTHMKLKPLPSAAQSK